MNNIERLQEAAKPVEVRTFDDIRRVLLPILSDKTKDVPIVFDCKLPWSTDNDSGVDEVKCYSNDASLYRILIDGMNMVKRHQEAVERAKATYDELDKDELPSSATALLNIDGVKFNVDLLIKRRLGGVRNGLRVRWTVQEGMYEFDPYTKRLFEVGR
jgi:hypothetical protein